MMFVRTGPPARRRVTPLAVGLLLTALACSAEADRTDATVHIDTLPGGRIRVTNSGASSWTDATAWRLDEDLRLGTVDGGGPEQLGQVADFVTDSDGRIYVLEYLAQEVRVFDAQGKYLHTIGRKGQGPAELQGAAGLNMAPDGRLWVWDPGNGRYAVFEPSGELVTTYRRQVRGVLYPWLGVCLPDGTYMDWGLDFPDADMSSGRMGARAVFYPIHFTPPDRLDTLPPIEVDNQLAANGRTRRPFAGSVTLTQDEQGRIWLADAGTYAVYQRTPEGDTVRVFTMPTRPAAVTPSERDSVIAHYKQYPSGLAIGPDDVSPTKPVVRRIISDNAGHLYVMVQEEGVPGGTALDAFDDTGVYLGRVSIPNGVALTNPPPYVTRDHVYVLVLDDMDVPFLVRYRIVRPKG